VALLLNDVSDHQDALIMQAKIAACFAAFRQNADLEDDDAVNNPLVELQPGAIYDLGPNEQVTFAEPKGAGGAKEVDGIILRAIASGLGITFESLSGDLSGVNFSSGRMGRIEMDHNVRAWQDHIMLVQFLQPLAQWFLEAWFAQDGNPAVMGLQMQWTMPLRPIVDPGKEYAAEAAAVAAGFKSRQSVQRALGEDPETVDAEIVEDIEFNEEHGVLFSSSPKPAAAPMPEGDGGSSGGANKDEDEDNGDDDE
jgi:capsid protein